MFHTVRPLLLYQIRDTWFDVCAVRMLGALEAGRFDALGLYVPLRVSACSRYAALSGWAALNGTVCAKPIPQVSLLFLLCFTLTFL